MFSSSSLVACLDYRYFSSFILHLLIIQFMACKADKISVVIVPFNSVYHDYKHMNIFFVIKWN